MKTIFRREDNHKICYNKHRPLFCPMRWKGKWHWLIPYWTKSTWLGFDMIEGNQWSWEFFTEEEMVEERLVYNLVPETPGPDYGLL